MSRTRYPRRRIAAGLAVAATVVLTSCVAAEDDAASGDGVAGGTITIAAEVDADSLDPQQVTSTHAAMIFSHLYDTLVVTDENQAEVFPSLAESWEVSDDGLEYTFTLRDDVTFHSGKALTADDVVATFDRWGAEDSASPTAATVRSVTETVAVDEHTVRVVLSSPDNWFLTNISMPWASILNAEAITDPDYGSTSADGTGPFELGEWIPGDHMELIRNEDYTWGPETFDNRGPAHLDSITVRMIPEATTRLAAMQAGEAQIAPFGGTFLPYMDQIESDENLETYVYDLMNLQFGALKMAKPTMADVEVRQAINHAIDKQTLVDVVENGFATEAQGFLHPDMTYFWDGGDDAVYAYDPDRATTLLDQAGWVPGPDGIREKGGVRLTLQAYAGLSSEQMLTLIQEDLAEVGIELVPNLVDRTALYDIRRTETPDTNWIWLPYENADVLRTYFSCDQQPSPNRFNYCDEAFDALMTTALTSQDEAEITAAYEEAQKMVHDQAIAIPLYYRQEFITAATSVEGVEPFPQYGMALFKSLDLSLAE